MAAAAQERPRTDSKSSLASKYSNSEHVIHTLFSEFIRLAELKLNLVLTSTSNTAHAATQHSIISDYLSEQSFTTKRHSKNVLMRYLSKGADANFDEIISALSNLAKSKVRPVMDALVVWRKMKSDPVDIALVRSILGDDSSEAKVKEVQNALKERKMLAANYILCRVLIEIVKRVRNKDALTEDLGLKLEEMVFSQIKGADAESLIVSPNRLLNLDIFAELLGTLSVIRFQNVASRFFDELALVLPSQSTPSAQAESKADLLISSMRYLKLRVYPPEALDQTVEFMSTMAKAFNETHSTVIKHAYQHVLSELLLPIAAIATAEVNIPQWMASVDLIHQKSLKMSTKPRHAAGALPLIASLMAVSRKDAFLNKFSAVLDMFFTRFKDKDRQVKTVMVICLARVVWTYIYRCSEAITATQKRLDGIIKVLFPVGRKVLHPADVPLEPFIQIILFIGWKNPEFCIKQVLFYLMSVDFNATSYNLTMDQIAPERIIIVMKSYLALLRSSSRPAFPARSDNYPSGNIGDSQMDFDESIFRPLCLVDHTLNQRYVEILPKMTAFMYKVVKIVHTHIGSYLMSEEKFFGASGNSSSLGASNSIRAGTFNSSTYSSTFSTVESIGSILSKEKQQYYDLVRAWIHLLPGLMPEEPDIIDMLVKYTVHIEPELSKAAHDALLRLVAPMSCEKEMNVISARRHAIVKSFATFLLGISDRVPDVLERSLKLYIDIWNVWFEQLGSSMINSRAAIGTMSEGSVTTISGVESAANLVIWERLEELETVGLFFFCNCLPSIRAAALKVLNLAGQVYELHLAKDSRASSKSYLMKVIREIPISILSKHRQDYTYVAEGVILSKSKDPDFLSSLASSDTATDMVLWSKTFPDVVRMCFEHCPTIVHSVMEVVGDRLLLLHPSVVAAADPSRNQTSTITSKWSSRSVSPASDDLIDQWKYYLIYSCSCMTVSDPNWKKIKKSSARNSIVAAQELFHIALPLLNTEKSVIRIAAVMALGNVNYEIFRDLLDSLKPHLKTIIEDMRARYMRGSVKRVKRLERLRAEITHIFLLSTDAVVYGNLIKDDQFLKFIVSITHELYSFLSDNEVQLEWDHQILRFYYSTFVERFFDKVSEQDDPNRFIPFELRFSLYNLFEEWCGHGQRGNLMRERESKMILSVLEQVKDIRERGALTSAMEEQRKALEFSSLKSMAALCRGPLAPFDRSKLGAKFSLQAMFDWIQSIFADEDERIRPIGQTALENLLIYNHRDVGLWESYIITSYKDATNYKIAHGHFVALSHILSKRDYPGPRVKLMALALYKLSDSNKEVRDAAIEILRALEDRYQYISKIRDYKIAIRSVSSSTYRVASKEVSSNLAANHPEMTHEFLSEVFSRMEATSAAGQRELIRSCLPWLLNIELTLDESFGELSNLCWLLLWNLTYLTIRYSQNAESEIELIWADMTRNRKNVAPIIDFLIQHGLERRSHAFPVVAKKIVLHIGRTDACSVLVETLMVDVSPKAMIPVKKVRKSRFANMDMDVNYIAPLDEILQDETRRSILSKGLLATVYLVDFAIERSAQLEYYFPILIQASIVQLDYFSSIARDHARVLLSSLINFVIQKLPRQDRLVKHTDLIAQLADTQNLLPPPNGKSKTIECPTELEAIIATVHEIMTLVYSDFPQAWGETAVKWATSCPVRHIACRSLQVFRIISPIFTQKMLADLLVRLSNTSSDAASDVQGFATEILLTLKFVAAPLDGKKLLLFPQLFWTSMACLSSSVESEYAEAFQIAERFLTGLNVNDSMVSEVILANEPAADTSFGGIQPLIIRGLSSSQTHAKSFRLLLFISTFERDELVDRSGGRGLYLVLAIIPSLLMGMEGQPNREESTRVSESVRSSLGNQANMAPFMKLLESYEKNRYKGHDDFLKQLVAILRDGFIGIFDAGILKLYFDLLRNKSPEHRLVTLKILKAILPSFDHSNPSIESSLSIHLLQPLYSILRTDMAAETTDIFDEVIRLTSITGDQSIRTLLNSKSIVRMLHDNAAAIHFQDEGWTHDPLQMALTRAQLGAVITTYVAAAGPSTPLLKLTKSNEAMFNGEGEASRDQLNFMNEGDFVDYDDLVSKLQDLDEFFTEDMLNPEANEDDSSLQYISSENGSAPLELTVDTIVNRRSRIDTDAYASDDSGKDSPNSFSLEDALQRSHTPVDLVTPTRSKRLSPVEVQNAHSLKVLLTFPTQDNVVFDPMELCIDLSAALGLDKYGMTPLSKTQNSILTVLMPHETLSRSTELIALAEVIADTVTQNMMIRNQFPILDSARPCEIFIEHQGIRTPYFQKEYSPAPSGFDNFLGIETVSDLLCDPNHSNIQSAFGHIQLDLVKILKEHLLEVSGNADELYIKSFISHLRHLRALTAPTWNLEKVLMRLNTMYPVLTNYLEIVSTMIENDDDDVDVFQIGAINTLEIICNLMTTQLVSPYSPNSNAILDTIGHYEGTPESSPEQHPPEEIYELNPVPTLARMTILDDAPFPPPPLKRDRDDE